MTHVKWLRSITVLDRTFEGYQQSTAYHFRTVEGDRGAPVTRILPRALMVPPGVPDFMSRARIVAPSRQSIEGRAWSGMGAITAVEFSCDGGATWSGAELDHETSQYAWRGWRYTWDATEPGEYELCARATDAAGNVQPLDQRWNFEGVQNNAVQRVRVTVGAADEQQSPADSI
jgi:sulfane dehydrogenase subunit SoxC